MRHVRCLNCMTFCTDGFCTSGWVANADLVDLEPDKVLDLINSKMRKDLVDAHQLAAQHNSLEHYKGLLQQFAEDQAAHQQALEAKAQATPAKKSRKSKGADVDEDVEMADASEEPAKEKKTKKRKAEDDTAVSLDPPFHLIDIILIPTDTSAIGLRQEA